MPAKKCRSTSLTGPVARKVIPVEGRKVAATPRPNTFVPLPLPTRESWAHGASARGNAAPVKAPSCRTFHDLRQFAFSLSPASRMAPGEVAAPLHDGTSGGEATRLPQPRWRIELLRRPLRRITAWRVTESLYHGMPVKDYSEILECGHEQMAFYFEGDKPAKRRRCRECGRRP